MGVDQSTSNEEASDPSADQENNNNVGRKRRNLEENGGNPLSLGNIITFFTVGSGVLLLIILGLLIFGNFGLFSSQAGGNDVGGAEREHERGEVKNKVKGDVEIRTSDEGPLSSRKKRKEMKKKLNRLVEEIKNLQSFRDRDKETLNQLQKQVDTIIDFVETVDQKNGNVPEAKRKEVSQAKKRMENLRKKLIDAYNSNQQPNVAEKLDSLNFDVVWAVGGELDKIMKKNQ